MGGSLVTDRPALAAQSERLLGRRLCAGDESALGEVYDQYSSFVFGLALRVIGDRAAAEDVAQDIFVGLWERPERFEPDRGSLRAYLGTLTHRRSVDLIRREEARRRRETKTTSERVVERPSDDDALARVASDEVRHAVASLPPAQREAVELAYFHGHTYRQVASALGIPEGTAKSRLRLALARVAELLTPDLSEQWA
jgi:RNA polymerase sigma-70 factor (ECF subfamily)